MTSEVAIGEYLASALKENATLRAEVERLGKALNVARYGEPDFAWSIYEAQMVDLRAENERLRAALHGLLNGVLTNMPVTKEEFGLIKEAHAALAQEKQGCGCAPGDCAAEETGGPCGRKP